MKTVFISTMFIVMFIPAIMVSIPALSNPIPYPAIVLKKEYMEFNFTRSDDQVFVSFHGRYWMDNVGYKRVEMKFPLPREVLYDEYRGSIRVSVNGKIVNYTIIPVDSSNYVTAYGTLPMISWITRDLGGITIDVYYKYSFEINKAKPGMKYGYTIYALGTGRHYYSKNCIADIVIHTYNFNNSILNIYKHGVRKEENSILVYATTIGDNGEYRLRLISPPFSGFKRDLVFYIIDINRSLYIPADPYKMTITFDNAFGGDVIYVYGLMKTRFKTPVITGLRYSIIRTTFERYIDIYIYMLTYCGEKIDKWNNISFEYDIEASITEGSTIRIFLNDRQYYNRTFKERITQFSVTLTPFEKIYGNPTICNMLMNESTTSNESVTNTTMVEEGNKSTIPNQNKTRNTTQPGARNSLMDNLIMPVLIILLLVSVGFLIVKRIIR